MPEGTWTCEGCGQIYALSEVACPVCRVTRENRHVVGKIEQPRTPKPPPELVDVPFPFTLREARFNLPLDKGAVWASGTVMITEAGFFLLSEKDSIDTASLAETPPAAAGPDGSL